jgi:integrase
MDDRRDDERYSSSIVRSRIYARIVMPAYSDPRDERWRYRKWVALPNGTRIRITGTPATNTKKAAEDAERMHVLRVTNPGLVPELASPPAGAQGATRKEVPTIREYMKEFLAGYLPDQKPRERGSKEQILNGHLLPAFGMLRLDELLQKHVDAFVKRELKRGIARKTINNRLAVLSSLLKYAHENKLIDKPTLRLHLKRGGRKDAPILAVPSEDVQRLVKAATDERYRVAVLLAAEAGLRIGEILGLQWGDIQGGELRVRRAVDSLGNVGPPKHDKTREVPLSPELDRELGRMRRRGLWVVSTLDGGMLSYWAAVDAVRAIYDRAGVDVPESETGQTMPWHSLRHSFGTDCARRGVPLGTLKELMGHEKIETTLRYVQVTSEAKHQAIAQAFGQQVGNKSSERT